MKDEGKNICAWCYFARMREDICGIYCTGGFKNPDGSCNRFLSWEEYKKHCGMQPAPEDAE